MHAPTSFAKWLEYITTIYFFLVTTIYIEKRLVHTCLCGMVTQFFCLQIFVTAPNICSMQEGHRNLSGHAPTVDGEVQIVEKKKKPSAKIRFA